MNPHYHVNLETFVATGIMAVVFINVVRLTAAWAVKSNAPILQSAGKAAGSLINFGG